MIKHILALSFAICVTTTLVFLPDAFYDSSAWGAENHHEVTKKHRVETKPKNHAGKLNSSKKSIVPGETLQMKVTAYCMPGSGRQKKPDINGPDGTSSGAPLEIGVAAVRSHALPIGTKLYVPGYGKATVLDSMGGSADLDIFVGRGPGAKKAASQWGVQHLNVTVLDIPDGKTKHQRAENQAYQLAQE